MLNQLLKKYDKQLGCKRNLDGTITIYRISPYNTLKFDILTISNQYLGSNRWVLRKIASMDSTRNDFIVKALQHNLNLKRKRTDKRISSEIADFMNNGGMTFLN